MDAVVEDEVVRCRIAIQQRDPLPQFNTLILVERGIMDALGDRFLDRRKFYRA